MPLILKNLKNNSDYIHFIYYSKELPRKNKDFLLSLSEVHDRLCVISSEDSGLRDELLNIHAQRVFGSEFSGEAVAASFKLDDDDLIAADYVESLKKYATRDFLGFAVSFGRGVLGRFDSKNNDYIGFREVYQPKVNIGLATIDKCVVSSGVLKIKAKSRGSHTYIDKKRPLVLDSREVKFLWTKGGEQDTSVGKEEYDKKIQKRFSQLPEVSDALLKECFDI